MYGPNRESLDSEQEVEIRFDFGLSSFEDHIFYMWGGVGICAYLGAKRMNSGKD